MEKKGWPTKLSSLPHAKINQEGKHVLSGRYIKQAILIKYQ